MNEEAVRTQLGRILASPQFAQSERLSRFLRLVVESAHKGDALKEYRIGVEVFDRGRDFDPRTDPIVRVQAAKLRSKLLEYYSGGGASDPLVIAVPKGGYAAEIRAAATTEPPPPSAQRPTNVAVAPRSRVAVLPFASMSSDAENEHFSDGLTEELINRLAQVPTLQVVARTSAFRFKNRAADIREVGAQLNVGAVVEGSVRRAGEQIRVTAQLIDVATGYHLFSRTYQRQFRDVFALQDEIAQAVADEIAGEGAAAPRVRKTKAPADFGAYVVYQRAMLALRNAFGEFGAAVDLFKEAIALDPKFAAAWGGLAHAYWLMTWYRIMPAVESMPLCRQAAEKTLELDPNAAEGHCSLGIVKSGFEWRWREAEAHFERAIELQPSLAIIYPFYAVVCLTPQRKLDKACAMIKRSRELDPFNPLSLVIGALIYSWAGHYDAVHRLHRVGLDLSPELPPTLPVESITQEQEGHLDVAIEGFGRMANMRPEIMGFLGHALARAGRHKEALQCVDRLQGLPVPAPLDIARVYVGLRDADEALRWLATAVAQHTPHLILMPADPRFDWLRSDARYADVVKPMALG
jgi:serine/threonine-protein kinase